MTFLLEQNFLLTQATANDGKQGIVTGERRHI